MEFDLNKANFKSGIFGKYNLKITWHSIEVNDKAWKLDYIKGGQIIKKVRNTIKTSDPERLWKFLTDEAELMSMVRENILYMLATGKEEPTFEDRERYKGVQ